MGRISGIGTTHVPYLMNAPENLLIFRKLLCAFAERLEGRPFVEPAEALEEMGDDPEAVAREHHRLHWEAFDALRRHVDEEKPDCILMIGDDQAQCFQENNLPPYAIYVGDEVEATPFYMSRFPGDAEYVKDTWGVAVDHTYHWPCDAELAIALRDGLIEDGFDIASSNDLNSERWSYGLGHAHANTQLFLRNDDGGIPIVPLFINCYGSELAIFSQLTGGEPPPAPFPRAPRSERLYDMGRSIRRILEERPGNVMICPSSTWSHTWLTKRHGRMRMDLEGNLEKVKWFEAGEAARMREYDSPQIEDNGDHELRNWIVAAGIIGDRPMELVCQLASWVSTGFRVFGIWR
ncbi:MAG: hypothetical protein M5T61_17785 [Acidimicrobiia bacterium]|nr:hypothetical protein [Acidimicrobiia bacterium]